MENKKVKSKILVLIAILFFIFSIPNVAKASFWLKEEQLRTSSAEEQAAGYKDKIGFAIGDPGANESSKKTGAVLWKFVKYADHESGEGEEKINFYCVKAGTGFLNPAERYEYVNHYDFIKDRDTMISEGSEKLKTIVGKDLNSDKDPYYAIIALSDLMYIKGTMTSDGAYTTEGTSTQADKELLLKNAGITDNKLTDNIIDAVQQAALWYFTDYDDETNYTTVYDKYKTGAESLATWFTFTDETKHDTKYNYSSITDLKDVDAEGEVLAGQVAKLYNYLIRTTIANIPSYKDESKQSKNKITLYTNKGNSNTQPVIVIEKAKPFDLALRKYITQIDDTVLANDNRTRIPTINSTNLENGSEMTAKYNHRKDPVPVKTNSIVTYNITIYNEGARIGYAKEIVDQLPDGLHYEGMDEATTAKFDADYDETNNKVTFTRKGSDDKLEAYTDGDPDSETLTIKCKVTATASATGSKVLTNVAWISDARDENDSEMKQVGDDRDSLPSNSPATDTPKVAKDNMENYKGKDSNDPVSDNKDYYWEGRQDDDDFEKLVLQANAFDLRLKKTIFDVNGTTVPERIKSVDVSGLKAGTDTDADIKMNKDPIKVKKGDIVKYRIRVYNEGDMDGYASEITEDVPEGLEFIYSDKTESEIKADTTLTQQEKDAILHNQLIWTPSKINNDTKKYIEVTTNYLAKGEGLEKTQVGANLIKAFNKEKDYIDTADEKNPDYRDVYIYMKVIAENISGNVIRNEAAITKHQDANGTELPDQTPGVDRDSEPGNWPGKDDHTKYQDDEDYDNIILEEFDLALRKFIAGLSQDVTVEESDYLKNANGKYVREPEVDTSLLETEGADGKIITTAEYNHPKDPLLINESDYIIYDIRVYNEGDVDGYASEIIDYLPDGLDYVDCDFNKTNGWQYDETTRTIKTTILKDKLIEAKKELTVSGTNANRYELDYEDVQIMCKLNGKVKVDVIQTNMAEITQDKDKDNKDVEDRDSQPNNFDEPDEDKKPTFKEEIKDSYVPGDQDDDDFEKVQVKPFDLALRKFITKIQDQSVTSRIPQVKYDAENQKITYEHGKDPLEVGTGMVVEYTIRVFNEGARAGYAAQILDDIPEGLKFLPDNDTNTEYRWVMYRKLREGETVAQIEGQTIVQDGQTYVKTENVDEAEVIVTDYLSKEQGESGMLAQEIDPETGLNINPNLLHAFNKDEEISDTNPEYKDVKVAFEVVEPNTSDKIIVNSAQISKDTDEKGNEVEDTDSEPGKWTEGEDDQDKEYLKLTYFDLALRKWVTQAIVIENGKQTVTQTGHTPEQDPEPIVKVDLDRKKLDSVTVKFRYSIRITNQGDIAGYAKEITDYVPEGLKFLAEDNPGWTDAGNNVIKTNLLADRLLQPGESADIEVVLTWINAQDNMGLKTNTAEISEDYNDRGIPDRDSTPDNKKPGEDDIDDAPVMLSVKTGQIPMYTALGFSILSIIAGGVTLIKKYVI